jgi:hypothetical protein
MIHKADKRDLDYLQQQVDALQSIVNNLIQVNERLGMEVTLLRNDLDIIKTEGCWRFVENPQHIHKDE